MERPPIHRRSSLLLPALLALAAILPTQPLHAGDALRTVQQRGTLIWGADQEGGGPYIYPAADDPTRMEGFEVEFAEVLARQLGVKPQFAQGQWDKLPNLLERGDIDVVLNGYEWTPARAERYGLSIPYYIYELQLLARRDDASLRSWNDVRKPRDGRPKRIAVLGGSAAQDYLESLGPDVVDVASFEGPIDAIKAAELAVDGVDASLQDLPIWTYYQSDYPRLTAIGEPVGRGYYIVMTRKGEPELLQAINAGILKLAQDGTLRRIYSKYRLWNQTQAGRGLEVDAEGSFRGDESTRESPDAEHEDFIAVRGWAVIWQRGWLLIQAAGMTLALSVTAMPLAVLLGLCLALTRMYGPRFFGRTATLYVEFVRGTPLVLQLYVIFFLLPELGIKFNAFGAAVLGLAINYSAYEAEIYRAGLQAIPRGQMEAALALGMSRWLALRRVIIPQATRIVIPPMTNDFIALFKDTAVCSVITVVELSKQYYIQARSSGSIVELGVLTAVLYLAMSYPLSVLAARLEQRLAQERHR